MSGVFKGRREGGRLVRGQGRYPADWNRPGQAYGCFLRSDRAHAEIAMLDVAEAPRLPGVLAVITGRDLVQSGFKTPRPIAPFKGRGGRVLNGPQRPALAHGVVRFVGEPVALVVAESEWLAQDAAERSAVDYSELAPPIQREGGATS